MRFIMKADITFDANNIDDALFKLEEHFRNIRNQKDSNLITRGSILIDGHVKEEQPETSHRKLEQFKDY